jgi:hypothetical protein
MKIKVNAFHRMVASFQEGTILYFNSNKQLHRDDGPAITIPSGEQHWYKNGKLHRLDGPASIIPLMAGVSGIECWYKNGKLHRLDGPACIEVTMDEDIPKWYKNGKLHRIGGPATRDWMSISHFKPGFPYATSMADCWYKDGKLHREDGPAVIFLPDSVNTVIRGDWYLRGRRLDDIMHVKVTDDDRWALIQGDFIHNMMILNKLGMNAEMQEYIISHRPDQITRIADLDPKVKKKFSHELNLSGIEI